MADTIQYHREQDVKIYNLSNLLALSLKLSKNCVRLRNDTREEYTKGFIHTRNES